MVSGAFAAVDDLGRLRRQPQQIGIHQRVIDDHVRAPEQFRAAQREQSRVARPGADQINCAFRFHGLKRAIRKQVLPKERLEVFRYKFRFLFATLREIG